MDILEEISKLTQLPKPIKTAKFETITKSPEEAAGAAIDFKLIKSKNVKVSLIMINYLLLKIYDDKIKINN